MRMTVPGGVADFTDALGRVNAYFQPGITALEIGQARQIESEKSSKN
jgi:hypothetical protein